MRRIHFERRTDRQRKRAGKYRESLRYRGITYMPKRKK